MPADQASTTKKSTKLATSQPAAKRDGKEIRILARSKSNIGPDTGGFQYFLEQMEAAPGVWASCVTWGKGVEGSARELLAEEEAPEEGMTANDAADMLREVLADGSPMPMTDASKPLRSAGFSKDQIWRASKKLGCIRGKAGMKGGWTIRLPVAVSPSEDREDCVIRDVRSSQSSAQSSSNAKNPDEVQI